MEGAPRPFGADEAACEAIMDERVGPTAAEEEVEEVEEVEEEEEAGLERGLESDSSEDILTIFPKKRFFILQKVCGRSLIVQVDVMLSVGPCWGCR